MFSVQGAWTRASVVIDGGEHFETHLVYWLQAGRAFADLRVPGGPFLAAGDPDGGACLVRTGGHAITVVDDRPRGGAFAACYRVRNGRGWDVSAAIGSPAVAAGIPSPADIPAHWLPLDSLLEAVSP